MTTDKELLQQALDFCEFAWRDVPMNDYAFERLEATIAALRDRLAREEEPPKRILSKCGNWSYPHD